MYAEWELVDETDLGVSDSEHAVEHRFKQSISSSNFEILHVQRKAPLAEENKHGEGVQAANPKQEGVEDKAGKGAGRATGLVSQDHGLIGLWLALAVFALAGFYEVFAEEIQAPPRIETAAPDLRASVADCGQGEESPKAKIHMQPYSIVYHTEIAHEHMASTSQGVNVQSGSPAHVLYATIPNRATYKCRGHEVPSPPLLSNTTTYSQASLCFVKPY